MDQTDLSILSILQDRARIKKSEMARELDIPATTLQERLRRLESNGVIKNYQAVIDPEKVGLGVQAFVAVSLNRHESINIRNFERAIKTITSIKACYHVSGRFDYLLYLVAGDLQQLGKIVKVQITALPDFGRCETYLVFSEIESSKAWSFMEAQPISS
jgi:DNA-binding Lrp family transcriptional regulator